MVKRLAGSGVPEDDPTLLAHGREDLPIRRKNQGSGFAFMAKAQRTEAGHSPGWQWVAEAVGVGLLGAWPGRRAGQGFGGGVRCLLDCGPALRQTDAARENAGQADQQRYHAQLRHVEALEHALRQRRGLRRHLSADCPRSVRKCNRRPDGGRCETGRQLRRPDLR